MKGLNDLPSEGPFHAVAGVPETASPSLIEGMKRGDSTSFQRFKHLFGGWLLRKTQAKGVRSQDDEDIMQEVLIAVSKGIGSFERQQAGSFRRWVLTIHSRRVADYYREKKRRVNPVGGDDNMDFLKHLPNAVEDYDHWPDDERASITGEAWKLIVDGILRGESEEKTFEAGRLAFLEGLEAAEVVDRLRKLNPTWEMKPSAVYVAKSRFKARLRKTLREPDIELRLRGILAEFGIEPPHDFLDNIRRDLDEPGALGNKLPGTPDDQRPGPG
jgi:DNA-directed RNA polymerase specialized sigma24 family protein